MYDYFSYELHPSNFKTIQLKMLISKNVLFIGNPNHTIFFFFLQLHLQHGSPWARVQMGAASVIYTTAHSNGGSLTH